MSIRTRLANLERNTPGNRGRCIVLPLYEGETQDNALAACPEIEPGPNDLVIFTRHYSPVTGERQPPVITPMVR